MNIQPDTTPDFPDFNRRDFVKASSFAAAMAMLGGVPIIAADEKSDASAPSKATVKCGVIGCGVWGREILGSLARLPKAEVVAVCDHYEAFLNRGKEAAPKAKAYTDYKQLLADENVKAVLVATPTHQHKEIVLDALKAGKHVYCEAPLATNIEDARTIARAAREATKLNFQSGLLMRSDPQRRFLVPFVRSGAMGTTVKARAQWHKKTSWRRTSPKPEREKELNWRLQSGSLGLVGEVGIQQIDVINWFFNARPTAITGFAGTLLWNDGREVPDTVQTVLEYASGATLNYEASLATSFDSDYELLFGSDSSIMLRGSKAWMFKEVDAPLLGWEVYALKEQFFNETGIALVANATKSSKTDASKSQNEAAFTDPPIYFALESFLSNTELVASAVEDFTATFDPNDTKALKEYIAGIAKSRLPAAGYQDGYESTVTVIKANEAVLKRQRVKIEKELFEI